MAASEKSIPKGWKVVKQLDKLGNVYGGLSGKTKEDFGEGKPYITYLNIFNNSKVSETEVGYVKIKEHEKQNKLKYGDFIFTTSSETIEEVGMTSVFLGQEDKFYLNSFCFIFRLHHFNDLIPEFARYLFRSYDVRYRINLCGQGSTRYNLSKGKLFKELELSIPKSLEEQRLIAEILNKIDEAIHETEKLILKHNCIKNGLMQDLLTKGIDKDGKVRTEATHEFEEKEGYKFPKEWQFTTVEKSIQLIEQGWSPNCDSDPAAVNEWGILKTTSVTWDGYNEHENKRMPNKLTPKTQYEVKQGDVLITRAGPNSRVGVVSYVAQTRPKLIFSDKIYRITPKKGLLNQYLALALSSDFTQRHLSKFKTGMAESQTNISQKIVKALFILIPEPEEQMRIIEKVDKMDEALKVFSMDLEKLQSLKRGLSQDLLTGKVSVTKLIKDESAAV